MFVGGSGALGDVAFSAWHFHPTEPRRLFVIGSFEEVDRPVFEDFALELCLWLTRFLGGGFVFLFVHSDALWSRFSLLG